MLAKPVNSMKIPPPTSGTMLTFSSTDAALVTHRSLEQLRVDDPELGEEQRDRRDAGGDVQALREPVEPGRPGEGSNHLGGFCWRWDQKPVAKQTVNDTPSAMPSHAQCARRAARCGSAAGSVCVIGPTASTAKRRHSLSQASTMSRPMAARDRGQAIEARPWSNGTRVRRGRRVSARTSTTSCSASSGFDLDDDAAVVAEEVDDPRQQRDRIAADADVAVEQQRGAPTSRAPGTRSNTERSEHVDAACARHVEEGVSRCRCRARRRWRSRERDEVATGPAPDVERRSDGVVERALLGRARPPRTTGAQEDRGRARRRCRGERGAAMIVMPRPGACERRGERASGDSAATAHGIGERVDVAERTPARATVSPSASRPRASAVGRCRAVDISTPSNSPGRGVRTPMVQ